jgi:phosphopantothenoylcysteine decarboxylase/phosphopantothenate--cysteine ligase
MSRSKILFFVTGSIAAFKAAEAVSKLAQEGHDVQVVFSRSASKFVGKMTFEGLTGKPVLDDLFEEDRAMAHIHLARWAEVFVLCPASADVLSRLARGAADDLITALFLAKDPTVPALIFPAMNTKMWENPLVQRNVEILNSVPGIEVANPPEGSLACGETGAGRLPDLQTLLTKIYQAVNKGPKVLITGGGTAEPIDSVRSITNFSSGQTASQMADFFTARGFQVDLLLSETARVQPQNTKALPFNSHQDLEDKLKARLSQHSYALVVHLAAVSDYRVRKAAEGKISSDQEEIQLTLSRTPKLIQSLKEWSRNKEAVLVGFKLTSGSEEGERRQKAARLLEQASLSGVVSNDLSEISRNLHPGFYLNRTGERLAFEKKTELFEILLQQMEKQT